MAGVPDFSSCGYPSTPPALCTTTPDTRRPGISGPGDQGLV
jgi:hypothetical protein